MEYETKCPECDGPNATDAKICRWCNTDLRVLPLVTSAAQAEPLVPPSPRPSARASRLPSASLAQAFDARMHASEESRITVAEPLPGAEGLARVPTHVKGLDDLLGGGFPEGSVVLIEGGPGTMKSSLALWVLAHNAANAARRGVYLSFEQSAGSLFQQMTSLGVPLKDASDRLVIADPAQLAHAVRGGRQDWLDALRRIVEPLCKNGLSLLVLDSLESLDGLVRFRERPHELLRLFEWLRELGLTSMIIAEHSDTAVGSRDAGVVHEEDFLADGIIQVRLQPVGGDDVHRRLRIRKMRGVRHATDDLAFRVRSGQLEVATLSGQLSEKVPLPPPPPP